MRGAQIGAKHTLIKPTSATKAGTLTRVHGSDGCGGSWPTVPPSGAQVVSCKASLVRGLSDAVRAAAQLFVVVLLPDLFERGLCIFAHAAIFVLEREC
jgi:hypothetical protein